MRFKNERDGDFFATEKETGIVFAIALAIASRTLASLLKEESREIQKNLVEEAVDLYRKCTPQELERFVARNFELGITSENYNDRSQANNSN